MRRLMGLLLVLVLLGAGLGWGWLNQPLALATDTVDLSIEPDTSPRSVAQAAVDAGVQTSPLALYWWFRLSGQARQIKAGSYEFAGELSPKSLLTKLVRGDEALRAVTLVEGWSFKQVRAALRKAEHLAQDTQGLMFALDFIAPVFLEKPLAADGQALITSSQITTRLPWASRLMDQIVS